MDYEEIERSKWMVRAVASLFYVVFVVAVSAVDSYVIHSGMSSFVKVGLAVLGAFILFPILDGAVERRLRRKHKGPKS